MAHAHMQCPDPRQLLYVPLLWKFHAVNIYLRDCRPLERTGFIQHLSLSMSKPWMMKRPWRSASTSNQILYCVDVVLGRKSCSHVYPVPSHPPRCCLRTRHGRQDKISELATSIEHQPAYEHGHCLKRENRCIAAERIYRALNASHVWDRQFRPSPLSPRTFVNGRSVAY